MDSPITLSATSSKFQVSLKTVKNPYKHPVIPKNIKLTMMRINYNLSKVLKLSSETRALSTKFFYLHYSVHLIYERE